MKLCFYTNCQGDGISHFLKMVLPERLKIDVWHNWQMIMGEQNPEEMNRSASECDVFIYQPTPSVKFGVLSTEELIATKVPKSAKRISFAYAYNNGLWPIVKHSGGWEVGRHFLRLLEGRTNAEVLLSYNSGEINWDMPRRFLHCLGEMSRREAELVRGAQDHAIEVAPFILRNYKARRLFLTENHPASPILTYIAGEILMILWRLQAPFIRPDILTDTYPWKDNEANIPGGCYETHPACERELGLQFGKGEPYDRYRILLEEFLSDRVANIEKSH